jgi:predicted small metal-binding protein
VFASSDSLQTNTLSRDAGFDCKHVMRGPTEDEVMRQAGEHAKAVHNMSSISPEVAAKVRSLIRDEKA